MVKMVVFDLDGTLINSLTDLAISVNYGLKLNRLEEKPVENYKTYVGNGREMLIRRAMGARGPIMSFLKRSRLITTDTMPSIATTTLPHMTVVQKCLKSLHKKVLKRVCCQTSPMNLLIKC